MVWLDPTYGETFVYLVARDPRGLHVAWEVARPAPGRGLVLRLYDVTDVVFDGFNAHAMFEVDDFLRDKTSYWVEVAPGRTYVAELGWREPRSTSFQRVARSNPVFAPRGRDEKAERYAAWGQVPCDANDVGHGSATYDRYLNWKQRRSTLPDERGTFALVLHQHLPFVRHPEHEVALEEQWFFEAVGSVYTQLLAMMQRLDADHVDFRLTVSLTPSLLAMMQDPLLRVRTRRYLDELVALAIRERDRADGQADHAALDQVVSRALVARDVFDGYEGDLTRGYRAFQDRGKLEVITSAATHFVLPLHLHHPAIVRAQVALGCRQYERVFGRRPRGFWLPENAFSPGLDAFLAAEGIRWTLVSAKSLAEGDTRCFYDTARPVVSPAGVAFFGIDEVTRGRIWSREDGFPGHADFKEWYRDRGHDLHWDDLPAYWKAGDVRRNTGVKVHRIGPRGTPLGHKAPYDPEVARATVRAQAAAFVAERAAQVNQLAAALHVRPNVVSAYDAELFGHWWEEGPDFLEALLRGLSEQTTVRPVTPSEACDGSLQRLMPGAASWGRGDYFQTWVEERTYQPNHWILRHVYRLSGKLTTLATQCAGTNDPLCSRALDQAARCLCLAGASDWPFLISTGQAIRYSETQVVAQLDRVRELLRQVEAGAVNASWLEAIEEADTVFPFGDMDFRLFAQPNGSQ